MSLRLSCWGQKMEKLIREALSEDDTQKLVEALISAGVCKDEKEVVMRGIQNLLSRHFRSRDVRYSSHSREGRSCGLWVLLPRFVHRLICRSYGLELSGMPGYPWDLLGEGATDWSGLEQRTKQGDAEGFVRDAPICPLLSGL